jgi:ABC-type dipeptide/oligopeptide/nickel transport system permease component
MLTYLLRRILLFFPTLIGITALVFFVMNLAPGGVTGALMNQGEMRPAERKAREEYANRRYGLKAPAPVKYLRWLNKVSPLGWRTDDEGHHLGFGLKAPDLGQSFIKNRPVGDLILEALPITLLLNLISLPLTYFISIVTGIYAARHRGKGFDITSGSILLGLWSIPIIWAGVMLQGFFASTNYLYWFPTGDLHDVVASSAPFMPRWTAPGFQPGWLLDAAWHLVLPVICLSYGSFAFLSKLTRSAMLENLSADFVRTARAKGVAEKNVLFRHVFRNGLLPLITVAANILPSLLGGAVVTETIFSINGMGKLMVEAAFFRDFELVLSETLVASILVLISYLAADVCYAVADPRVAYE